MKEFDSVSEFELLSYATGYLIDQMSYLKNRLSDPLSDMCKKELRDLYDHYEMQYNELFSRYYPLLLEN